MSRPKPPRILLAPPEAAGVPVQPLRTRIMRLLLNVPRSLRPMTVPDVAKWLKMSDRTQEVRESLDDLVGKGFLRGWMEHGDSRHRGAHVYDLTERSEAVGHLLIHSTEVRDA